MGMFGKLVLLFCVSGGLDQILNCWSESHPTLDPALGPSLPLEILLNLLAVWQTSVILHGLKCIVRDLDQLLLLSEALILYL